jgi:hypothetical protein
MRNILEKKKIWKLKQPDLLLGIFNGAVTIEEVL